MIVSSRGIAVIALAGLAVALPACGGSSSPTEPITPAPANPNDTTAGATATATAPSTAAAKTTAASVTTTAAPTAAIDAKKLFVQGKGQATACGACHTLAVAGTTGTTGPNLNTFIEAGDDQAAIKEMIVKPNAEIAKGYQASIMPQNYGTTLTAAEITALVNYIYDGTHGKNAAK